MNDKKIILQGNAVTQGKYDYSALQKNLLYEVISQLNPSNSSNESFFVSVSHLQTKTGTSNSYAEYKRATKDLIGKVMEIEKDNGNLLQVAPISSAEYHKGSGVVELSIDPKIKPYYLELKEQFTVFELGLALSLKSKYSKRLYEMCAQFRTTGVWVVSLDDLRDRLRLGDKLGLYADFNKRVLKVAKKEINQFTDISIDYAPVKFGRKVQSIKFSIKSQGHQKLIEFNDEEGELYGRLIAKYKLSKWQADKVMQDNTPQEIRKIMHQLQTEFDPKKSRGIGAFAAYKFGFTKRE